MSTDARRAGFTLLALGCAPFVAGAIVPADGDTGLICPFRELTGAAVPAVRRDAGVRARRARGRRVHELQRGLGLVAALLIVAGALALLTRRSPALTPRVSGALVVVLAATAWAYALAAARDDRRLA